MMGEMWSSLADIQEQAKMNGIHNTIRAFQNSWLPCAGFYDFFILWALSHASHSCTLDTQANSTPAKHIHCKKRLTIFLSPAGMSSTKLSLDGNN